MVDLPIRSVRRYLNRWGFTPQRPLKQAFEQRPEAVRKWLERDYPAIAARTKAEGAEIYWGDETAVSHTKHSPRVYAPISVFQPLTDQFFWNHALPDPYLLAPREN